MLMGSADENSTIDLSQKKIFMEDLSQEEKAKLTKETTGVRNYLI